MTGRH